MSDVFDKCTSWKDYRIAKATGLYPYFRPIEASHSSNGQGNCTSPPGKSGTWVLFRLPQLLI